MLSGVNHFQGNSGSPTSLNHPIMKNHISFLCLISVALVSLQGCGGNNETATISSQPLSDTTKSPTAPSRQEQAAENDTVTATCTVEAALPEKPLQKQLDELQDEIARKLKEIGPENPLCANIWMTAVEEDSVIVSLTINTNYWQQQFQELISDSPLIKFDGPSQPKKIDVTLSHDFSADSIFISPDQKSYPANAANASFIIRYEGGHILTFGEKYIVGYKETNGNWYKLPHPGVWNDIGYILTKGGSHHFDVLLYPALNHNKPGIYRLYKEVSFENSDSTFWIMTEFTLTGN